MSEPLRLPLRSSLVRLLTESLRGGFSPDVAKIIRGVRAFVHDDALDLALRALDRIWRSRPDAAEEIAPLYARALVLDGSDYDAAVSVARFATESAVDPDDTATHVLALLRRARTNDALRLLETALADYCVIPGGLLASVAGEVMRHPAIHAPGWMGVGPDLNLVGELTSAVQSSGLVVSVADASVRVRFEDVDLSGFKRRHWRADCAGRAASGIRVAHSAGERLLGSGARTAADFLLDGRVENKGSRLTVWARLGWLPDLPPRLRVDDEHGARFEVDNSAAPRPGRRWSYPVDLRKAGVRGRILRVSAQLPHGRWHPLPDAPFLLDAPMFRDAPMPIDTRRPRRKATAPIRRPIDVIIPIYGNREEALECIDAVISTVRDQAHIVVVDDASEDPWLSAALGLLESDGRITLLVNTDNLGFAATVNRGLAQNSAHDAVVLNSDTRVFGDWLSRLQAAAYGSARVGTVTPLSNNGSIASYPQREGGLPPTRGAAEALHALAVATHAGTRVEIPVGVGFCLYMRRDCLLEVGDLDAAVFGKGYGEETDFCLRARRLGWSHQLAADVYVLHAGGQSFGARRAALLDRSQRLLNLRHPGYDRSIARFLARDPLLRVRRALDERRLIGHAGRLVLIVTLALPGGVDRFVKDRCRILRARGLSPVLLRPVKPGDSGRCELWSEDVTVPNLRYDIPTELPALEALLRALPIESIEMQHFLGLDPRVVEAVRRLPSPYDLYVHDYAWLCPRVTLIDGSGHYCGEPAVTVCERCVRRNGSSLGEDIPVKALRKRSAVWLSGAQHVFAPSVDTASRIRRHFPGLSVEVRRHSAPPLPALPPPGDPQRGVVRVALIGAIGAHKGYDVLLECARDARARRLPLEFVVIGYTEKDAPLLATGKVFVTGPYIDGEAPHLIARERPDIAWLPSVWPETWCYTLDHALAAALPVAAFDLGAIAERLAEHNESLSRVLLLPLATKSQRINDALLGFAMGSVDAARAALNSVKWLPAHARKMASIEALKTSGKRMTKAANARLSQDAQEAALSASVQVLPLAAGLYLFSVKAANPTTAQGGTQLSLPAMHIGLGPGVHSDQVEFISSPTTHGAWLFAATDLVVARINGGGATLILTSVRAPNGDVLSIKVERLDGRTTAAEPAVRAVAAVPLTAVPAPKAADAPLSLHIRTHVRTRGDMEFVDAAWAGRLGSGLWIESFAVRPLEHIAAHDIEYKGLTGSGFETPWLSDNTACGTQGMGVPLVGFAMRLRPSAAAAALDCEYSGFFQSGLTVGPLRNGSPCRSSVANDPLEGIQVRIVRRPGATAAPTAKTNTPARAKTLPPVRTPAAGRNGMPGNGASPVAGRKNSTTVVKPGKRAALAR